ncbi:MAG: bifunctional oligoribonuclease/PAP phosphatase NrnA [Clostridia bacterium]|nr:bifunctional oligoribonuclease/PAP phosphatase NrnA [Clostridia bacterium]
MNNFTFSELGEKIQGLSGRVAILTHERADADTVGSSVALSYILSALGTDSIIVSPDGIPLRLMFLSPKTGEVADADTVISVDVPSLSQLGKYAEIKDRILFKIDHHHRSEEYAPGYVDSSCAAAGEIIFDLGEALLNEGIITELPKEYYEAVYTAISSDSGCFKFSNVTPSTHIRAAKILESGIDAAEINRLLFDSKTKEEVAAARLAYSALNLYRDDSIAVITFTIDMQKECGADSRDLGALVDIPRSISGVLAAVVIKESAPGEYRVSLRSNGDLDVSLVAAIYGGGGHIRASGCSINAKTPEDAEREIVSSVISEIEKQGIK